MIKNMMGLKGIPWSDYTLTDAPVKLLTKILCTIQKHATIIFRVFGLKSGLGEYFLDNFRSQAN